jgi:hypothetical protein
MLKAREIILLIFWNSLIIFSGCNQKNNGVNFEYSIGIIRGESPFNLSEEGIMNPVLTAKHVTDVQAEFVADPFMVYDKDIWYMFFEVKIKEGHGSIGLATSKDGINWVYEKIVINEPFHLSYPYVFKWEGKYYMIPESYQANEIRLYEASDFPEKWSLVKPIIHGNCVDPSIFRYNDRWWLFTETASRGSKIAELYGLNSRLCLFFSDSLRGPWCEHYKNPIIDKDANIARPGGRVLIYNGRIFRFTQDCDPAYGKLVRAFKITKLSTVEYEEEPIVENPILEGSGEGWNAEGMHHIDIHRLDKDRWIACVDGWHFTRKK